MEKTMNVSDIYCVPVAGITKLKSYFRVELYLFIVFWNKGIWEKWLLV